MKFAAALLFSVVALSGAALAAPKVELLVKNALLIPVADARPDSFAGYFTVGADGRIIALEAGEPPAALADSAERVLDVEGKIVAPGFISAHSHIYMSPLRGLGHDQTLYGWFESWDRYLRHATAEDLYWFSYHGALDFLRNGLTTAYDFTHPGAFGPPAVAAGEVVAPGYILPGPFEENQIDAKIAAGLRFIDSVSIIELETPEATRERFERTLAHFEKRKKESPLALKMAISGEVQFLPEKKTAYLEAEYMERYDLLNQTHFLESPDRVAEQQVKFDWYVEAGALGPRLIFGHFIHVTDAIVAAVAASGAKMSWQPTSNGRLADGIADIVRYRAAGIPVAVGLDDQSCTDVADPFQNVRIGLYTMRGLHKSAAALSIRDMLRLHTLGSAEVLGIERDVGSLEPGKFADFLVVDPRDPDTGPTYEPLATYVLATSLRNLRQVYVAGRLKAEGARLVGVDEQALRREIDVRTDRLRAAAGDPPRP
jgi:5-methylthioadenosine/S-adenosylhomocysteine deaminase